MTPKILVFLLKGEFADLFSYAQALVLQGYA